MQVPGEVPVNSFIINLTEQKCHAVTASEHTRRHLILVYQPHSCTPLAVATVARFPLKERPFHSVRRRRICIEIYGLLPATHPSYHSASGSQHLLKMQPLCLWFCATIPSEPLKDNSGSHPRPTSCFLPGSLDYESFNVTSHLCVPAQAPLLGLNTQHGCLTVVTE